MQPDTHDNCAILTEHIPDRRDTTVSGGVNERNLARAALKEAVLILRRIAVDADTENYNESASEYKNYNRLMTVGIPTIVINAERWSLFNPAVHDAHALRQYLHSTKQSQ